MSNIFPKPALSEQELLDKLEKRGLIIEDREQALSYLKTIGYYRLSAYLYPLLSFPKENHLFKDGSTFRNALNLYFFDRKLRILIFSQLEKIEVALRATIVRRGVEFYGDKMWLNDEALFYNKKQFEKSSELINKEWIKSKEDFKKHFDEKYKDKYNPPIWMLIEVIPLGVLSNIYMNIKSTSLKNAISRDFALPYMVFASWLQSLSGIRNICCHHNRLWNRILPTKPMILVSPKYKWIAENIEIDTRKTYYKIAMIQYLLYSINPSNHFIDNLKELISKNNFVDTRAMGFPFKKDDFLQI